MSVINMRDEAKYPHLVKGLKDLISHLPKNIILGEVGSYAGHSAKIFLDNASIDDMYCIDPWCTGYDDTDGASLSDMVAVEAEFDKRILDEYDTVTKIKKGSIDAVSDFDDGFFDVMYIDGNHQYEAVLEDIKAWLPKVKKGGIICGHDYYKTATRDPKKAVDEVFGKPHMTFADTSWMVRL